MTAIRVVDLETTGLDPVDHRVIEIGWCDLVTDRVGRAGDPIDWLVSERHHGNMLVNPGRPIPPESSAVHHLIDADVRKAGTWRDAAAISFADMTESHPIVAFCAHNIKFERQWCTDDLIGTRPWICTYKCALRLWPDAPSHSNQALRYWRNPTGLDRNIASVAHRAWPDAYVTAFLLRDMLNAGTSVETLVEWSSQPALTVRCHVGKFRGQPWADVEIGFLRWMLDKDFDEDTLFSVRHEIEKRAGAQT